MVAENSAPPVGLDPLIAEAKRRTRRRRVLVLTLLVVVAAAVGMFFGLRRPSAAPISVKPTGGPAGNLLALSGGSFTSDNSPGDRAPAFGSIFLACRSRRRYMDGVVLQNRSHGPVTVLGVRRRSPAPRIVQRVATQFRVTPFHRFHNRDGGTYVSAAYGQSYSWSAVATGPVTVPARRTVNVQSEFVFKHCRQLAGGREVAVPGSLVIRYRADGVVRQQVITLSTLGFTLGTVPKRN